MQIDTSGPALLQLEASTAASLAVCVAHLLQSLPENQRSAQWSKAIAAYSPFDPFICGSSALQLLSDAADAQPSATVTDISFDVRLNVRPAKLEPLIQLCQYFKFGTEEHSAAAESPAVAVRAQADADSAEADIRCLLDLVVANRHCREFPATKLNLPDVSALTALGTDGISQSCSAFVQPHTMQLPDVSIKCIPDIYTALKLSSDLSCCCMSRSTSSAQTRSTLHVRQSKLQVQN